MALNDKKFNQDLFTRIFDVWARKTPSYEKHYEQEVIKVISDFGKGTNEASDAKGKILGAGYEPLIMAFFIGLYSKKKIPFDQYADIKDLGQPSLSKIEGIYLYRISCSYTRNRLDSIRQRQVDSQRDCCIIDVYDGRVYKLWISNYSRQIERRRKLFL